MFDNLAFPVLAIMLGIKHAYDLDHILVISNIIMNKSRNIDTLKIIGFWTTGHMITVGIVTIIIYSISSNFTYYLSYFQNISALLLVIIGTYTLAIGIPVKHSHQHSHQHSHEDEEMHEHKHTHRIGGIFLSRNKEHDIHKATGTGIIHGLASNDELLILFIVGLEVKSHLVLINGFLLFMIGIIFGLVIFACIFNSIKGQFYKFSTAISFTISTMTISYGLYLLYGNSGLNLLKII